MLYKKLDLELIVLAGEAEAVVAELNTAIDQMEERYEIFGGEIKITAIEHPGSPRKSAVSHTVAAGKTAVAAVKSAREHVKSALHHVI